MAHPFHPGESIFLVPYLTFCQLLALELRGGMVGSPTWTQLPSSPALQSWECAQQVRLGTHVLGGTGVSAEASGRITGTQ